MASSTWALALGVVRKIDPNNIETHNIRATVALMTTSFVTRISSQQITSHARPWGAWTRVMSVSIGPLML
jgi:hypothetical protein